LGGGGGGGGFNCCGIDAAAVAPPLSSLSGVLVRRGLSIPEDVIGIRAAAAAAAGVATGVDAGDGVADEEAGSLEDCLALTLKMSSLERSTVHCLKFFSTLARLALLTAAALEPWRILTWAAKASILTLEPQ